MGNGSRGLQQDSYLLCDRDVPFLFTENETNQARLFGLEKGHDAVTLKIVRSY